MLLAKGEYQWCLSHLGDPQARFDSIRQSFDMDRDRQKRMRRRGKEPRNRVAVNEPAARPDELLRLRPDTSAMMKKFAEDRFVGQTRQLIEILVATGHKADAEGIRDQAIGVLDDPRLKSPVERCGAEVGK